MERRTIVIMMKNIDTGATSQYNGETVLTVDEIAVVLEDAYYNKWNDASLEDQYNQFDKGIDK